MQNHSGKFRHEPSRSRATAIALLIMLVLGIGNPQIAAASDDAPTVVNVDVGMAEAVQMPEAAINVFIADPEIADVQVSNKTSFIVFGKKAGKTTVYATASSGRISRYEIAVSHPTEDIAAELRSQVPKADVTVTSLPNGLLVSGAVASPRDAETLKTVARQYLGDKENLIFNVGVRESTQVNLQLRVAEVDKLAAKDFGFNWSALFNNGTIAIGLLTGRTPVTTFGNFIPSPSPENYDSIGLGYRSSGGSVNLSSLLDALQNEGLISILAEPNLTAVSGETANFLAGGEFPIPVSQGYQQISIDFKQYGVSVDFTPTVLDDNRLSIKVRPEVSELSTAGAVTIDGIQIPSLAVRRANTTVELASGQSFAIAGLFQSNASNNVQQLPGVGDLPILGALFRSTQFQRQESELVIIVTPYIVKPATSAAELHLPTEGLVYASDIEQLLLGRLTGAPAKAGASQPGDDPHAHLSGPAGFLLE